MRDRQRRGRSPWLAAFAAAATSLITTITTTGTAAAAPRSGEDVDAQLAAYENEVRSLADDLPRPNQLPGTGPRRLVDAEIAYALGDYDGAALMLFDLATKPGPDRETASFYLGEALYQKADRSAARGYYEQVVAGGNVASRYYQPSLERLIEIAIAQHDESTVAEHVAALDRISPGLRLPSVPYIRGKLAYAQGKTDEAIAYFQDVPKGSDYELQATYYMATVYVAKQDMQRATDIFVDLVGKKPRTANDRRIIELSQLALGRLYYERDQPSKSIDSYLLVDRHSDLFPDALYEVGWVYVKNKQYDKALRALELLSKSDPQSTKTPTVRILEGNLRIRKAQMIRGALIQGTLDNRDPDDPATEYDKAVQIFTDTHETYVPSYAALAHIVDAGADPAQYLSQIAGRFEHVFQAAAPIPDAAVQYLRDEPAVQRVVAVEGDLGEIHADIAATEAMIARLEGVLAAGDKTSVYPALANRRVRIGVIEDDLIKIRSDLADQQLALINAPAAEAPAAARKQAVAAFQAMPNPEQAADKQRLAHRVQLDAIEATAADVDSAVGAAQAMSVALHKYSLDTPDMPADQKKTLAGSLDDTAREAEAIESELDDVRRELQLGRDLSEVGDRIGPAARAARSQVKAAEDAEHKALIGIAGSRDPGAAGALAGQAERAERLAGQLEDAQQQIDGVVDQGLREVRSTVGELRATLSAYKAELGEDETETRSLGGAVLGASFKDVKAKLYDIVIRTDVGTVDVAWSQKSDTDDDLKRLNLSRQRELKQLKDEFKDILDAGTTKPSAPAKKLDMPRPEGQPTGSPDQRANTDARVAPTSTPSAPATPTVRPEDAKAAKAKATPPKAAPRANSSPTAPAPPRPTGAAGGPQQ